MWRRVSIRTPLHVALSLAVSLPILVDVHVRFQPTAKLWAVLAGLNLAIWCSWPRYRSLALRQATMTVTLLIAANLLLSPLIPLIWGERTITLPPNHQVRFRHIGDTRLGLEGVHEMTTDGRGHRVNGPIDYAKKPVDALRIVAIGGSTTEQSDIDDRKAWTWLVAEDLSAALGRKVEMINTGVSGARGPHYYEALRSSEAYAPDVALFLMGINDWNAAIKAANRSPLDRVLRVFLPFSFFDSVLFNAAMTVRGTISAALGWGQDAEHVWEDDGRFLYEQNDSLQRPHKVDFRLDAVDDDYAGWVGRIMTECRRRAILCLFVEQPTAYGADIEPGLRRRLWMTPMNESYTLGLDDMRRVAATYNDWLAGTAKNAAFPFCATAAAFPPTLRLFYDDCHFTTAGSRHLASVVSTCLLGMRDRLGASRPAQPSR